MVEYEDLVRQLGSLLIKRRWMVSTAESCTGGLLGHALTSLSGSSNYFQGGVIAYSNYLKRSLLGVPAELLETVGAVSSPVALAMARGVRQVCSSQVGLATTGIAGPSGGTPAKPIGTVYIAYADEHAEQVLHLVWQGDRNSNNANSVRAALELALTRLQG
ncbi:MAG: CinA family protein [Chloroflexi bacterium]|nr:CinA family protein [Chloroflexota bacterium]